MKESCGYLGHVCGLKPVQFISRYRDENDYCVNGHRVSLADDGTFTRGDAREFEAVRLFELDQYAAYIRWHVENKARLGLAGLLPFNHQFKEILQ